MNKEQKKKYSNILRAKGFTKTQIEAYIAYKEKLDNVVVLAEGQAVKLNIKQMKSHPDYMRLTQKRRDWVESHLDDVFTVEYPNSEERNPVWVCLKEDKSDPKWFFWTGDLTKINN